MGKYFGTDGIRGKANTGNMTPNFALKLGVAIAKILKVNNKKKTSVVIGKDTRLSGYMLESSLTAGLTSAGVDEVFMIGPVPTPGVAMLVKSMRCDLGIVISASHNPYYDNGIKLFDKNGIKFPDDIEKQIEEQLEKDDLFDNLPTESGIGRAWRSDNYIYQQRYIQHIKTTFPKENDLYGVKLVVDCANGANYKIAPLVLWELGATVEKIFCEPNGININDNCGSTKPENLQKKVVETGAELGIAFDGDADRVLMVDEKGELIDGDKIIALIAKKMLNEGKLKNNTVVATQMSNLGFELYMNSIGIDVIRTKIGDRYVSEAMREKGLNLGGEQSGHIILGDFSYTGDGLCTALQVLDLYKQKKNENPDFKFSELFNLYETVPQKLNNVRYKDKNPLENQEIIDLIAEKEKQLQGIGRILIRKSGTEPVIRVMVECRDENKLNEVIEELTEKIEKNI